MLMAAGRRDVPGYHHEAVPLRRTQRRVAPHRHHRREQSAVRDLHVRDSGRATASSTPAAPIASSSRTAAESDDDQRSAGASRTLNSSTRAACTRADRARYLARAAASSSSRPSIRTATLRRARTSTTTKPVHVRSKPKSGDFAHGSVRDAARENDRDAMASGFSRTDRGRGIRSHDDVYVRHLWQCADRTVTDTATSQSRTRTYTYNSHGQVLTVDGPRTDVTDVTMSLITSAPMVRNADRSRRSRTRSATRPGS